MCTAAGAQDCPLCEESQPGHSLTILTCGRRDAMKLGTAPPVCGFGAGSGTSELAMCCSREEPAAA